MSIIDTTYFVKDISLPNTDANENSIQGFIDLIEPVVLRDCLGEDLKNAFVAGLAEPSPAQKWIDLRDGKVVRWLKGSGFISGVGKALKSPRPLTVYNVQVQDDKILIEI